MRTADLDISRLSLAERIQLARDQGRMTLRLVVRAPAEADILDSALW